SITGTNVTAASNTNYSGSGVMLAEPDITSNAGTYVPAPEIGRPWTNSPLMEYQVEFLTAGTNYIWVRGLGDSPPGLSVNDSVFIGLDGVLAAGLTGF